MSVEKWTCVEINGSNHKAGMSVSFVLFCESLCCFLSFIPFIGERAKS